MEQNSFHDTLKALGKTAKRERQEAEERAKQEAAKQREEMVFAEALKDVVPLKKSSGRYEPPRDLSPIKVRDKSETARDESSYFYVGYSGEDTPPSTFSKNGQGKNDIQRLQNGHYEVAADVDLHGYTQEEAQQVLNEFIEFLKPRGVCGEIVHGSGLGSRGYQPVLKNLVRRWLMAHPDVLAYAEPHKNNDGSVRILIKRRRREDY